MASHLRNLSRFSIARVPSPNISNNIHILTRAKRPTIPSRTAAPLTQRNTMATETPKREWLVVVPDFPGAHEKRLEVRPKHFAGLAPFKESGQYQEGGALLNEVPTSEDPSKFSFYGSTIVMQASSREEIKEILRKDVYAQAGVWDVENAQIWPYLCAFRNPK
ncbi:hypothetical protein VTK26DRAFT_1244 [Humicola hyalothermophila]